jgi:hypothetical protein
VILAVGLVRVGDVDRLGDTGFDGLVDTRAHCTEDRRPEHGALTLPEDRH